MDWNKQMEEMMSTLTETQRRMWDNWLETVKRFSNDMPQGGAGPGQDYKANLEAWEKSVRQALEAQNEWAKRWSEQSGGKPPEGMEQWMQQMQEMMKGWTEAQKQLWDAWFQSIQQVDPGKAASQWEKESKQVLEAWQQAAQRAQDTMMQWSQTMQQGQGGGSGSKGGGGKKS